MNTLAHSAAFWIGLIMLLLVVYFLPTMIGMARKVESLGLLIFLNILPTGVGWLAALVLAFVLPKREVQPDYQVVTYRRIVPGPPGYWH